MPCPRSPALALVVLGAYLGACFSDPGGPSLTSEPGLASTSIDPTTADPSTGSADTSTTGTGTTGTSTTTATTSEEATSTGCVQTKWYFDVDNDGFGGPMSTLNCGSPGAGYYEDSLDCNDANPAINPKANEVCDAVDNDCDSGIDEYPANEVAACNGCRSLVGTTSVYHYCAPPGLGWADARTQCMKLLGDLVVINDAAEKNLVLDNIGNPEQGFWIGLSDSVNGGTMVWVDGTPLNPDLIVWDGGEPDNAANCVLIGISNKGYDTICEDPHGFICEALLPT